ncbi:hypothetical protein IIA79_08410, partial [bacterium]|nr:hypothetical protein [bacterium]
PASLKLGGHTAVDAGRARRYVTKLGQRLGLSAEECALGIIRLADQQMAGAVREVTQLRGHDPRRCTLIPFGGAGPLHACGIADQLAITTILVPPQAGCLSALGALISRPRRDVSATILKDLAHWTPEHRGKVFLRLSRLIERELPPPLRWRRRAYCRYEGQSFELAVAGDGDIAGAFHAEHERAYGYRRDGHPIEVVTIQVSGESRSRTPRGVWRVERGARGEDFEGKEIAGPVSISEETATTYVAQGWRARLDSAGNLWLRRSHMP